MNASRLSLVLLVFLTSTAHAAAWLPNTALPGARKNHEAALLLDGRVLLVGGDGPSSSSPVEVRFDPATSNWTSVSSGFQRRNARVAVLSDGKVLSTGSYLKFWQVFTPATSTWSSTPNRVDGSANHPVIAEPNGIALVIGGSRTGGYPLATTVRYNSVTNTYALGPPLTMTRSGGTAHQLSHGRIVLFAGQTDDLRMTNTTEVLDVGATAFRSVGPMVTTRYALTSSVLLKDDRILVVGGENTSAKAISSVEIFDPATETWSTSTPAPTTLSGATLTLLDDGRVLVAGGGTISTSTSAIANAWLFDPATRAFTPTASLPGPRRYHSATKLQDGRVLVAGGTDGYDYLSSVVVYDVTASAPDAGSPPDAAAPPDSGARPDAAFVDASAPDAQSASDAGTPADAADPGVVDAGAVGGSDADDLPAPDPDPEGEAAGCSCSHAGDAGLIVSLALLLPVSRRRRAH